MDLKLITALLIGKIISILLKFTGSGATAAPGLVALKIDKDLVKKLSTRIKNGSIVISGTNGKTTTARIAFDLLSKSNNVIHNRQGSNLARGIASTLISKTSLHGKISADLGVWEVDEAVLGEAVLNLSPNTIVLLNLFRDQLDRYGEVDTILKKWKDICTTLPKTTTLIINGDDPGIASLSKTFRGKLITFGIQNMKSKNLPEGISDVKQCPLCQKQLKFTNVTYAHLGKFQCTSCNFSNPPVKIFAENLSFAKDFSTTATLGIGSRKTQIRFPLPGVYNTYNVLAAASIALEQNIQIPEIKNSILNFTPAFGRFQKINIGGKIIYLFLIKNPAGANEVLKTLNSQTIINLVVILNDNFADGRDVSWIWDTDWKQISTKVKSLYISGNRSFDMATRLKYADFNMSKNYVYEHIKNSIESAITNMDTNDTLYILPTYTSLLAVNKILKKERGLTKWQTQ